MAFSVTAKQQDLNPTKVVTTSNGEIQGSMVTPDIQAFLGIPYAAPPVRDLRWRDPQPVSSWQGVYHADQFGPQCMQPQRGIMTNQYSGSEVTSEDCLYLNVWAKTGIEKAPVIVFIHGGGFFIGAGSMPLYGGEQVAQHGAVFVNLNYRVGPLGFLAHPELTNESSHSTSGNYGFLDQVAALRWVHDNIDKFGGDPANVTIVGQSAGSMSVLALQASPLTKGLFHRAVGMSGALLAATGPFSLRSLDVAENDGIRLQEIWNANNLAELRALPADRLVVPRKPSSPPVGPIVDGYVLPTEISKIFSRKAQNDVPLLVGFTRDEAFGGLGPVDSLADYQKRAAATFGERASEFLALYPASDDRQAISQARAADRDNTIALGMDSWARMQSSYGDAPVYSYMFSRPHVYPDDVIITNLDPASAGAYHTSEVPFWLGTLESFNRFRTLRDWREADRDFSHKMIDSLVAFARTGSPTIEAFNWPQYDPSQPVLLELGDIAKPKPWPAAKKFEFFRAAQRPPKDVEQVRD
ncbi:carboxylesterase/lipase family protein [Alteromonas gilva]|uniref:Carboxylic ester hydrolase n=1 Tax=Alteromonas gilva TaxID=2987522 RepID=A0ABT5L4T6_9ALTE|nr:carboxylesterase family protein [Alteromonas gilva]MDC8831872.1 carboxylesterase family protein [Alteromonas gilva]